MLPIPTTGSVKGFCWVKTTVIAHKNSVLATLFYPILK